MRLIDADELKTILSEEITRRFVRWDKTITVAEWETFTRDAIDNAPTESCTFCPGNTGEPLCGCKWWDEEYKGGNT